MFCLFWLYTSNPKLPPKQKKQGHPNGSELTVISLPKKKHRDDGLVAFIKRHPKEKESSIPQYLKGRGLVRT